MIVGGRYRLDQERGTGGMATVWLAHDLVLDRPAALKLLLPVEREAQSRRERLRAEARALAALDHPHVVRVYDFGQHEGKDYIVMEYLEGGSLAERLSMSGPLPPAEAARLLLQVLDALGAAHRCGIVHRDVKPGNVLLRGDGTAALCDFGVARTSDGPDTKTGVALGSMGYMAPEQRLDARKAGPQADLYAAACTLYNLLTADTPVDLYLALDSSPRWDPVPGPLRPVLRRATRSEPSARYHSAEEMAEALRLVLPALDGLPPARQTRPITPPIGYVPTVESEPTVRAEHKLRAVDVDEWSWASRPRPVGRPALWVGVSVLLAVTALGVAQGPMRAQLAQPSPPVPVEVEAPPPELAGIWTGSFGSHSGTLFLRGPPEALTGEVVLSLGSHELRSIVTGAWDPSAREIVLVEAAAARPATYRARLYPTGLILDGRLSRPGETESMPFALVRQ